jgi:1-acyl-sn-glycerol-3-phosphate acyltransferase
MRSRKPGAPPRTKRVRSPGGNPQSAIPAARKAAKPKSPALPLPPVMEPDADDARSTIPLTPPTAPGSSPLPADASIPVVIPTPPRSSPEEVAEQIRALEARLDRMIESGSSVVPSAPPTSRQLPGFLADTGERAVFDTARELLSTDFYMRKWGRLGMRNRSEEVDDFGFDPTYDQKVMPVLSFLYEKYFRVEAEGVAKIPGDGRCVLVCNHSGTLPYDGLMLKTCVKKDHPKHRDVRWLAEDFIFHFPFLGSMTNRIGAVRACQENAERLLRQDALVAVFPEGVKGIGKLFKERYKLQRFGRGGFVKLCLRTQTPVVPVAVVGAEEATPMLAKVTSFASALGLPYIPVTPTFPLLGPLGLVPAPTKWRILFGDPIHFDEYGAEAADDEILVGRLAERVRGEIQGMLDRAVADRRSVWFG